MILMYALKTPLSAQCAGVLSTEHSVQSNPSALSALSTEMHHQNKTLSTKCCHPHGHSVLSTSTVCAPDAGTPEVDRQKKSEKTGYQWSQMDFASQGP